MTWWTVVIFAGLVVLFLQRSASPEPQDKIYQYGPPSVGCALAKYLGNQHDDLLAIALIASVIVYVYFVLKPFNLKR